MTRHKIILWLSLTAGLLLSSCSKSSLPAASITTLSQAQQYFLKICKEELKYPVYVIPHGKTVWVYVPLTEGIVDIRAVPKNQLPEAAPQKNWSINFLETKLENNTIAVRYDITMTKNYDRPTTYKNKYTDEYNQKQREVLTALSRAYFDVGQKSADVPLSVGNQSAVKSDSDLAKKMAKNPLTDTSKETAPEFFVIVFADVTRGLAFKTITYFEDMRMALSSPPAISNEEYIKRYVSEIYGDEDLIGDPSASRLKTDEVHLGDFVTKQIENRIKFQFTQSSFPPSSEAQDEIWSIIAETCRIYNFKDFEKIKLIDLQTEKESTFDKSQL